MQRQVCLGEINKKGGKVMRSPLRIGCQSLSLSWEAVYHLPGKLADLFVRV
jgi:hypothetical protein